MNQKHRRWLAATALLGIIWGISLACYSSDTYESSGDGQWRYYAINPETLPNALDQNDPNAFTPLVTTPTPQPTPLALSVQWGQVEYFRIAQTIHEQAWAIPLDDHNLYSISFDLDCSSANGGGFSLAEFRSNDVIQAKNGDIRLEHWIMITPGQNIVSTMADYHRPNVNHKTPFDLRQFKITADEALQMAESNGGSAARLQAGNDCRISISSGDAQDWFILYTHYPDKGEHVGTTLYQARIDPRTGEYKVLYPKP